LVIRRSLKFKQGCKMRILLVEDGELLGDCMRCGLIHYKYDVVWIKSGLIAWGSLQVESFDLVILDFDLPNFSGERVLKNMRSRNITTPVIIITNRNSVDDRFKGLNIGADGYMGKPFELEELCARIRVIQKHTVSNVESIIAIDNIILDVATKRAFKFGKEIQLVRREFVLLQTLMEHAGSIISRGQLLQRL